MNGTAATDHNSVPPPPPPPLEWKFSQVFGERAAGEEVQEGTVSLDPSHFMGFCDQVTRNWIAIVAFSGVGSVKMPSLR